jgi:hypothetical protein
MRLVTVSLPQEARGSLAAKTLKLPSLPRAVPHPPPVLMLPWANARPDRVLIRGVAGLTRPVVTSCGPFARETDRA